MKIGRGVFGYFEDRAKAPLRAKSESDPRRIGFAPVKWLQDFTGQAFHRAGTEIGQKGTFFKGLGTGCEESVVHPLSNLF